jgi:hypothetical protein
MKNIIRMTILSLLIVIGQSFSSQAASVPPGDSTRDAAIASQMMVRLNEIQAMDKTSLSPSEKKDLTKELMKMKKKADGLNNKVYLSVGAIIIIILLLILILR